MGFMYCKGKVHMQLNLAFAYGKGFAELREKYTWQIYLAHGKVLAELADTWQGLSQVVCFNLSRITLMLGKCGISVLQEQ
jgi:hypothetical protein